MKGVFKFAVYLLLFSALTKLCYSLPMYHGVSNLLYMTIPNIHIADLISNMLIAVPVYILIKFLIYVRYI